MPPLIDRTGQSPQNSSTSANAALSRPKSVRSMASDSSVSTTQGYQTATDGFGDDALAPSPEQSLATAPQSAPSPGAKQTSRGIKLASNLVSPARTNRPTTPSPSLKSMPPTPYVEDEDGPQNSRSSTPLPSYDKTGDKAELKDVKDVQHGEDVKADAQTPTSPAVDRPKVSKLVAVSDVILGIKHLISNLPQRFPKTFRLLARVAAIGVAIAPVAIFCALAALPGGIFAFGLVVLLVPLVGVTFEVGRRYFNEALAYAQSQKPPQP